MRFATLIILATSSLTVLAMPTIDTTKTMSNLTELAFPKHALEARTLGLIGLLSGGHAGSSSSFLTISTCSSAFQAALNTKLGACKLSPSHQALLRASAMAKLSIYGGWSVNSYAGACGSILAAVDASVAANTYILGNVAGSMSAIESFTASLGTKIAGAGALAVRAQTSLAVNALVAIFNAGSSSAQAGACAGILDQVDASIHAGSGALVSGALSIDASFAAAISAGFTAALDTKINACGLSQADKAALRASAITALNGCRCGSRGFGYQTGFAGAVIAAVDISITTNTRALGAIGAAGDEAIAFGGTIESQIGSASKLDTSLQTALATNALAAVFGAGSASTQISACASVLSQVQASIAIGISTLGNISAGADAGVSGSVSSTIGGAANGSVGGSVGNAIGAGFNVTVFTNVTSAFTTAIDAKLAACSLTTADKANLRSSAFAAFFADNSTTFSAHCAFAAALIAAVHTSVAANTPILPNINAGIDAVASFAVSLDNKITQSTLSADLKAHLAANAIAAVYATGNVQTQTNACPSVLANVDSAISAGVAVIGSIQVGGSGSAPIGTAIPAGGALNATVSGSVTSFVVAAFTAALNARLDACSLDAAAQANLAAEALVALKGCVGLDVSAQAGFAAAVLLAVDAAIVAKSSMIGEVSAGLDAVVAFAASLDAKVTAAAGLVVDAQVSLAASALAGVYAAGNASAQAGACAGILSKVDAAISAGAHVIAGAAVSVSGLLTGSIGAALGVLFGGKVSSGCACH